LETSQDRALAARYLARDLIALEGKIVSLRRENYQLRTAAGGDAQTAGVDAGTDWLGGDVLASAGQSEAVGAADTADADALSPTHSPRCRGSIGQSQGLNVTRERDSWSATGDASTSSPSRPASRTAAAAAAAAAAPAPALDAAARCGDPGPPPARAVPIAFLGAIQRITVGGARIIGYAVKSSEFVDEDSGDEHDCPPAAAASATDRKTKQVMNPKS